MRRSLLFRTLAFVATLAAALASLPAFAQSLQVLHGFRQMWGMPNGPLVAGSDGSLYGTTRYDGTLAKGSIFKMTPDGAGGFTFSTLHEFNGTDGSSPGVLVRGTGTADVFYGTTSSGGANAKGTVFKVDAGGTFTSLHSFSGPDGSSPSGALTLGSDGLLYGATSSGGTNGKGTIFKVDSGGTFSPVHSFDGSDGGSPNSPLTLGGDGALYGTTRIGGGSAACTNGCGTIFKVDAGGAFTRLHSFDGTDGASPWAELVAGSDGAFYGTTVGGGTGNGTVFKIIEVDSIYTFMSLHSFSGTDGQSPFIGLREGSDGAFYGSTRFGGQYYSGTLFKVTSGGTFSDLHPLQYADGTNLISALILGADGDLYGTAQEGGNGRGTVFKLDSDGNVSVLHAFNGSDGFFATAPLIQVGGIFYGVTGQGGSYGKGTVFKIDSAGDFASLHSFSEQYWDGNSPHAALIQGSDGAFYGTTEVGGLASPNGVVFKIASDGTYTLLHGFDGSDGTGPQSALVEGTPGVFFGAATNGGPDSCGTIFKVDSEGSFTTLHAFTCSDGSNPQELVQGSDGAFYGITSGDTAFRIDGAGTFNTLHTFSSTDGSRPRWPLVEGADGYFYGVTIMGGTSTPYSLYGAGTIFKVDAQNHFTVLHSFLDTDGGQPLGALVRGTDGAFYGTTSTRGGGEAADGFGTVFKVDSAGTFTTLHTFSGPPEGISPQLALVQGSDGAFYGMTRYGGVNALGTIFKVTSDGTFTNLHSFDGTTDGSTPGAPLISGSDGFLYGVTPTGGTNNKGTIFKIDSTGNFTNLHSFNVSDGNEPQAALVQGTDGALYGTTRTGGPMGGGVVFRFGVSNPPSVSISASGPTSFCAGGSVLLTADASGGSGVYTSYQWSKDGSPISGETSSTCNATTSGSYTVTVTDSADATDESAAVDVDAHVASATVTGSAPICKGASATIQAALAGTPPWDLTWSDGFLQSGVTTSPVERIVAPTDTTTYSVVAVSDALCTGTASGSAVIDVQHEPKAYVTGSTAICLGGSATLETALTGTGPWHLTWSDGLEETVPSSPATRTVSPSVTTGYWITGLSDAACTGSSSGTATVKVSPLPSVAVRTAAALCEGAAGAKASVQNAGPGAQYEWTVTNGTITSGAGTRTITYTAGASGTLEIAVTVRGAQGCAGSGQVVVPVNGYPSASISAPAEVCPASTGNAASIPDAGPGATYAWTAKGATITSGQGTPTIAFAAGRKPMLLMVTVTNASGCRSTSTVVVGIRPGC